MTQPLGEVPRPLTGILLILGILAATIGTLNAIVGFVSAGVSIGLALFVAALAGGGGIWLAGLRRRGRVYGGAVGALGAGFEVVPIPDDEGSEHPCSGEPRRLRPPPVITNRPPRRPGVESAKELSRDISLAKLGLVVGIGAGVVTIANGIIDLINKFT